MFTIQIENFNPSLPLSIRLKYDPSSAGSSTNKSGVTTEIDDSGTSIKVLVVTTPTTTDRGATTEVGEPTAAPLTTDGIIAEVGKPQPSATTTPSTTELGAIAKVEELLTAATPSATEQDSSYPWNGPLPLYPSLDAEVFAYVGVSDIFKFDPFRCEGSIPTSSLQERVREELKQQPYKPKRSINIPIGTLTRCHTLGLSDIADLYYDPGDPVNAMQPGQQPPPVGPNHMSRRVRPPRPFSKKNGSMTWSFSKF